MTTLPRLTRQNAENPLPLPFPAEAEPGTPRRVQLILPTMMGAMQQPTLADQMALVQHHWSRVVEAGQVYTRPTSLSRLDKPESLAGRKEICEHKRASTQASRYTLVLSAWKPLVGRLDRVVRDVVQAQARKASYRTFAVLKDDVVRLQRDVNQKRQELSARVDSLRGKISKVRGTFARTAAGSRSLQDVRVREVMEVDHKLKNDLPAMEGALSTYNLFAAVTSEVYGLCRMLLRAVRAEEENRIPKPMQPKPE